MVIVFPRLTREIMDVVIPRGQMDRLPGLIALGLGAYFLQDFLNSLRIQINNTFEQKVIFDLRSDLYERLQRLPLRWFDNRPTGDIMTTVSEDIPAVERVLIDGIEQGVIAVLQIVVVGAFLFQTNAKLAWIALLPVPFLAAGALVYTLTSKNRAPQGPQGQQRDELAAARQRRGHAADQGLRHGEGGARALQPRERRAAPGHASRHARLVDLPARA